MNRLILLMCLLLIGKSSLSQTYVKPFAGISLTGITGDVIYPPYLPLPKLEKIKTINYGINIGTHIKNVRLETGINFLPVGAKSTDYIMSTPPSPQHPNGVFSDTMQITHRLTYLSIPISVGYKFKLTKRFCITPQIAFMPGILFLGYGHAERNNIEISHGRAFFPDGPYKRINIFGNAQVNLEYNITKSLSLAITPGYSRMLLPSVKDAHMFNSKNAFGTGSLNIGLMIKL